MALISMTDLFYGEREAVQILKDENREILEIIHRYNYFYTEPSPLSDVSDETSTDDSEDEDLESNWTGPESSQGVLDADEFRSQEPGIEGKSPILPEQEAKVALKVPMCCAECEETVTIALQNVAGNQPSVKGYQASSDNYRCLLTLVGIATVIGIVVVLTATGLHSA